MYSIENQNSARVSDNYLPWEEPATLTENFCPEMARFGAFRKFLRRGIRALHSAISQFSASETTPILRKKLAQT